MNSSDWELKSGSVGFGLGWLFRFSDFSAFATFASFATFSCHVIKFNYIPNRSLGSDLISNLKLMHFDWLFFEHVG